MARRRGERGSSAVEFALISLAFFTFVIGVIQYGWYFYVAQNTSGAVGVVTRKLQVGDCWASTDALTFAKGQSTQITALTKSPNQATAPAPGTTITITVTANAGIIGLIPMPSNGVVTRNVTAVMEDDKATTC
ncbi:MAG: TadE/TadG family type IV pilus assembly protein [Nocardioides sp.]